MPAPRFARHSHAHRPDYRLHRDYFDTSPGSRWPTRGWPLGVVEDRPFHAVAGAGRRPGVSIPGLVPIPLRPLGITTPNAVRHTFGQALESLLFSLSNFLRSLACANEGNPLFLNQAGRQLVRLDDTHHVDCTTIVDFFIPEQRGFIKNGRSLRTIVPGR